MYIQAHEKCRSRTNTERGNGGGGLWPSHLYERVALEYLNKQWPSDRGCGGDDTS